MFYNIFLKFNGRLLPKICTFLRENCKIEFVCEICNDQVMTINIVIFLIFSYYLENHFFLNRNFNALTLSF